MTGSNWPPGACVSLLLRRSSGTSKTWTTAVGSDGTFTTRYLVEPSDFKMKFELSASVTGSETSLRAEPISFTDGPSITNVSVGGQYGTLTVGNAGAVTFAVKSPAPVLRPCPPRSPLPVCLPV